MICERFKESKHAAGSGADTVDIFFEKFAESLGVDTGVEGWNRDGCGPLLLAGADFNFEVATKATELLQEAGDQPVYERQDGMPALTSYETAYDNDLQIVFVEAACECFKGVPRSV